MPVTNAEIAQVLREVADLLEIGEANPFRIRAYRNAARVVESYPESITEMAAEDGERLEQLPGIGADLAAKILEIAATGTVPLLADLRRQTPKGARDLMSVPSLGPKRTRRLQEELHIRSLADLERAARAGRIRTLRGFGAQTERRLLTELESLRGTRGRTLRSIAAHSGEPFLDWLRSLPGVTRAEIAGSFRRRLETVGDLDLLVTARSGTPVVSRFVDYPDVRTILAQGPTRASVRLRSGLQVDLRVLPDVSYGSGLYYFTGSKAHNIALRRRAQERGLKINEYGVFRGQRRIAGRTEEDVLETVGLPWIPPELREDRGEFDAAGSGHLPRLLELDAIRGDLQCHTTDSDGRDSLDKMADAAEQLGYEYLAITDHTPSVRVAGGMDRAGFRSQMKRIDRLNARRRSLTLLKGAEVDILADGSLDLDDDTLQALDLVVVSLHSRLTLPERAQTRRVCRALAHPSVDVLGHPSARLIGGRRPAALDWEEVYRVARDQGVMLEINAQPERLDLDDVHVRAAIGHGLTLTLGTDAHGTTELGFMRWGVDQARRGWAEADDIANTRPLKRLRALLHGQR
jgi:DNA polymerase (family 10)